MCPGGWIVPAATEPGGLVVNGMSLAKRNSPFANAALVVTVTGSDFGPDAKDLSQESTGNAASKRRRSRVEAAIFVRRPNVPPTFWQAVPATACPSRATVPVWSTPNWMMCSPNSLRRPCGKACPPSSSLARIHSRTGAVGRGGDPHQCSGSHPARSDDFGIPALAGLYPAGEGAGYAGGIVSSALDGVRVAAAIIRRATG